MRVWRAIFLLSSGLLTPQTIFAQGIPRDTSFTVYSAAVKVQKQYPFAKIIVPELPAGVVVHEDIVYLSLGPRELHLDVFQPEKPEDGPYPGVLLVHGGGWRSGSKSQMVPLAQKLAARRYVTAAVEYRLSIEAGYPAAVFDLKAAVRWMRANAQKYRIDSSKITILGCSAGAHLATLVGCTNGVRKFDDDTGWLEFSSDIQAIVNIDGLVDFTNPEALKYENIPEKPSVAILWLGGSFAERPERWREASPIYYVNADTPPIIFVNSILDRFHAGRDEMLEKFGKHNIYYEVHTIPDTPHPFWLFHPWFEPTFDLVLNFLNKTFNR